MAAERGDNCLQVLHSLQAALRFGHNGVFGQKMEKKIYSFRLCLQISNYLFPIFDQILRGGVRAMNVVRYKYFLITAFVKNAIRAALCILQILFAAENYFYMTRMFWRHKDVPVVLD